MSKNDIIINYHLTNTGNKTIKTNEYTHNFLAFDDELMGNQYKLQFPFEIDIELMWPPVNPEEKVEIGLDYLTFNNTPEEQFFFGNITGTQTKAQWVLINTNSEIGISESGDFKPSQINVWGWKHVISPELFFDINLEKGEEVKWSRSYRVFDME